MPIVKCRIIPQPEENTRTVFQWDGKGTFVAFFQGHGTTTYRCGLCPTVLLNQVEHGQVRNIVFRCPKCGSYNELP